MPKFMINCVNCVAPEPSVLDLHNYEPRIGRQMNGYRIIGYFWLGPKVEHGCQVVVRKV